jgi:predicted permease
MDKVIAVIGTVLPVFLALVLGMLCREKNLLSREGVDALKKVAINLTLPFVLFDAFAKAEYSLQALAQPVLVFAVCCVALGLGMLVIRISGSKSRLAPFLASGFEAGMLGYALFVMLFPQVSTAKFAILDLGQTLFVFTLYKILLSGKRDFKAIGRDMVTSPVLWAVALGVVAGASGLYANLGQWLGVVESVTGFMAAPTGVLILLSVGYDLVLREIPWGKTAGFIAMRLGVMAVMLAVIVALNRTVLNSMIFEGAAVLMLILPPPYVIPVFADEPAERSQISSALSALTLVTVILFAVLSVVGL